MNLDIYRKYKEKKIIKALHRIMNAMHYHLILITRSIGVMWQFKNNNKRFIEQLNGLKILAKDIIYII
jgi:transcriptional regulator of NAD metabolism